MSNQMNAKGLHNLKRKNARRGKKQEAFAKEPWGKKARKPLS